MGVEGGSTDTHNELVGVATAVGIRGATSKTHSIPRDRSHQIRDTTHSGRVDTARSTTTSVAYILYMDLLYILTGIFISAIAISVVLGRINGTLIW